MKQAKYFYLVTGLGKDHWISKEGTLKGFEHNKIHVGCEYWPFSRDKARYEKKHGVCYADPVRIILQFENKPPYKFIKQVS